MMKRTWLMVALAVVPACKKKDADGGGGTAKTAEGSGPFAGFSQPDAEKLWQGSFAGRLTMRTSGAMSMAGDPAAVTVKGAEATVFDGKADHKLAFEIDAPCSVAFHDKHPDGAVYTYGKAFLVRGGKLQIGEGAVGLRKGKSAVVCGGMGPYTIDDKGTCQKWHKMFDKWEAQPETCVWSNEGGKDVLTIGKGDWTTKLVADGDMLATEQFDDEAKKEYWKPSDDKAARDWATAETAAK